MNTNKKQVVEEEFKIQLSDGHLGCQGRNEEEKDACRVYAIFNGDNPAFCGLHSTSFTSAGFSLEEARLLIERYKYLLTRLGIAHQSSLVNRMRLTYKQAVNQSSSLDNKGYKKCLGLIIQKYIGHGNEPDQMFDFDKPIIIQ